ncbi:MAG: hypothetical protein NZM41_09235 [Saprospiraceae bacterium]|nr:hypothetical protein [Saprospiraceae bacterium]
MKKMFDNPHLAKCLSAVVVAAILLYARPTNAQTANDTVRLLLDLPLLDLPYQSYASRTEGNFLAGYGSPSMKQSLQMTTNLYSAAHFGAKEAFKGMNSPLLRAILTYGTATLFDLLSLQAPLGNAWLHEEYHRAVLTRREVKSANEVNRFPIGQEVIRVYRIADADLERMHDNHRNDWLRLQVAGKEGELHLLQTLQRNDFFYSQKMPHIPLYWLITFATGEYVRSCAKGDFNRIVNEMNDKEGRDILARDFTGPDYTAWAYALFRPEQRYKARGVHPSGVGINRYIKPADLTEEELDYIRKQGRLQWLNFLSPTLFGFSKICLKKSPKGNHYGNFAVRSVLTPFGNDVSVEAWYQSPGYNLFLVLHNYLNRDGFLTGLEMGMVDQPVFKGKLALSPRLMMWRQPENLSFTTTEGQLGGLLGLKARANLGRFNPYFEIEGKTAGWVMGNVFLEENVSVNAGVNVLFR